MADSKNSCIFAYQQTKIGEFIMDNENEDYLCLLSINKHFEEKDFSYMFKTYRFADGTPFGIK